MLKNTFRAALLAATMLTPDLALAQINGPPINNPTPSGPCITARGDTCVGVQELPANVMDFGALRNGVNDDTGAINAAAAAYVSSGNHYRNVYLPAGAYYVKGKLSGFNSQCLEGDGKWNTQIYIGTDFDPTVDRVASFLCAENIGFVFLQAQNATSRANSTTLAQGCDVSSTSVGVCKYPWAIKSPSFTSSSPGAFPEVASPMRVNYRHIMISGGWDGIDATQTGDIDDISIGTLDQGIHISNWADFGHVSHIHGYNWGFTAGGTFQTVFSDGTNLGLNIDRDDGTIYTDIVLFRQRMTFTTLASRATVNGLSLDGTASGLTVNSGSATAVFRVNGMYFGWGAANTGTGVGCPVMVGGAATLQIVNFSGSQDADKEATPLVCQTSGGLLLSQGSLNMGGTAPTSTITKSGVGSALTVNGVQFTECGSVCTMSVPVIADTSTGIGGTQIVGNEFNQLVGSTNVAFSIATDSLQNSTVGNSMANLLAVLPAGGLGNYDRRYGGPPAVTCNGTGTPSVSIVSNDVSGTVTTGVGVTTCSLVFVQGLGANAPNITITPEFPASTATMYTSAKSGTGFTETFSASVTSVKFDYHVGFSNGN